ncbi:MAG TPA: protein kinase [Polyangiaceae bacterium]|jgi:serine/threonine-protein kinase
MTEDVFGIVGSVIAGAYHVERVVAEGGFGVVYRAHHGGFRASVALKCLKIWAQEPRQQAFFLEQFQAEAELLFRLSASLPTVVRPLHADSFTAKDGRFVPYMVLEWLEGQTLDAMIQERIGSGQQPFQLRKLMRLLSPVARALERAHNFQGPDGPISIVHRDLKPENIFIADVAGEQIVKILDFGIGKAKSVASQVAGRMSQQVGGEVAFSPAYGAPEQWAPKRLGQTGPWTDVWGLALTMVEAMTGRTVILGDQAAMMGTALDLVRRPTPRNEGVEVPDEVESVFERALAVDPRVRQSDVGVFWNELEAAMRLPKDELAAGLRRDARAEDGGGTRVERIELKGVSSRPPPALSSRRGAAPAADSEELEFDPSSVPRPQGLAGPLPSLGHAVPELDFDAPPTSKRASTPPPAATSPLLEFDEASSPSASGALDLDLADDDPIAHRTGKSGQFAATSVRNSPLPPAARVSAPPEARSTPPEPMRRVSSVPPGKRVDSLPVLPNAAPPSVASSSSLAPFSRAPSGRLPSVMPMLEERPFSKRVVPAAMVVAAAILIALLDPLYAAINGEVLLILGMRLGVLAGALLLLGVGLGVRELVRESSDD